MKSNKEVAKEIIVSYYEALAGKDMLNSDGYMEVVAIKFNDEVLLEHIKAVKNIMDKAIKEMESQNE